MHFTFLDGDDDDTKGDDNKASADPSGVNDLGDDIGERIGKSGDKAESPL
jgi:hypothetical protein